MADAIQIPLVFTGVGGLLGVFLISFAGNAIPYSTIPYLFYIMAYGIIEDPVYKFLVALVGGLGAALGKVVVYLVGRAARVALSEASKKRLEAFNKLVAKSAFLAVFLFAALPLPDDVLYVPLGVAGYSFTKFFIALFLGKVLITGIAVALGSALGQLYVEATTVLPWWAALAVVVAVTIVLSLAIIRMDWEKLLRVYEEQGAVAVVKETIIEFFRSLLPRLS